MSNTKTEKQMIFMMPKELHTEFKVKCIQEGVSLKEVLVAMVESYVSGKEQENKNN